MVSGKNDEECSSPFKFEKVATLLKMNSFKCMFHMFYLNIKHIFFLGQPSVAASDFIVT